MWWNRGEIQPTKYTHPDEVRMDAMEEILACGVRAIAITMSRAAKRTPRQAVIDISNARTAWHHRLQGPNGVDTVASRHMFLFIMDYFWLPSTYLEKGGEGLGYGADWFEKLMLFFNKSDGGLALALMPNDSHHRILEELQEEEWCDA